MKMIPQKWTQSWAFYHVLLWTGIVVSHAVDSFELTRYDVGSYVTNVIVRNTLLIALTYTNLFVLIPRFYRQGRKVRYWLLLVLSIVSFILLYNNFLFTYLPVFLRGEYENSVLFQVTSNFFTSCRYLVLSLLLNFMQEWFEQEKKLKQVMIDKLTAELNYLRVQINPHFLFNTLNNIYGLALQKSDLAPPVILKLSAIMEYMLLENENQRVALKQEIENIRHYMDLEKIRQTGHHDIRFEVEGNDARKTIEPFLLFPFFENAFKHGISANPENGFLKARLHIRNHELNFTIENSKPAISGNGSVNHGTGLPTLRKRLLLLYPQRHDLAISNSPEIFSVSLTLKE